MKFIKKLNLKHIFILYLICLFVIIVLKFFGNVDAVITTIEGTYHARQTGVWNINFVPFVDLYDTYRYYLSKGDYKGAPVRVLFANIGLLIPLGFLLPFIQKSFNYFRVMGTCLLIIIGIELFQFISMLGITDIDDVVVNLLGCHLGYILALILQLIRITFGLNIPLLPTYRKSN